VQYKLLAVDVDGTLVRRDGTIHPDDAAAVGRLRAAGVPVTIATGRLYSGTRPVAAMLGLTGPIACVDGSHIVDVGDDRALFAHPIKGGDALLLRDVLARHHLARFLFAEDTIIHDDAGAPYASYVRTWSPHVDVVAEVLEHRAWAHDGGVMAVVALGSEEDVKGAAEELAASLPDTARVITFPVIRAQRFAMMVRALGPTKGTAVAWLAAHHGHTAAEVVVVGDWINDVPMFQAAGRSFAMRQAPPQVKAAASDTLEADGLVGGGIAEAIGRAFGI
jgi:hypothetical protein